MKCIRIKFHYLDNDPIRTINVPGDAYFFDLLRRMNNKLEPGKIRLTFDYNCIHRGEIEGIESSTDISDLIGLDDPDVEFDPDAVNIYFLENFTSLIPRGSNTGKHVVVGLDHFSVIMHELGHALGLRHTFVGNDGDNSALPPDPLGLSCKDVNALSGSTILCEVAGDGLCDTGIDPLTHDLDEDDERDGFKWVNLNTCTQSESLVASIPDGCNDTTTPWDIPIRNYMSYYFTCSSEFTPCQFGRIHEAMSVSHLSSLILDCEEDPFVTTLEECLAADITISSVVTWTNQTRYLCPGQKIIITPTGHLVLDNTVLTRLAQEAPLEACPSLFFEQVWDGIYIEGRGVYTLQGGTYYYLGGLTVKNGSVIEFSENGIQGLRGYGQVKIENSILRHNRQQVALRDPWPFSYAVESPGSLPLSFTNGSSLCGFSIFNPYPSVNINNSAVEIGEPSHFIDPLAPTQILVDLGNVTILNSEITNTGEVSQFTDITALKQARGKLLITNGTSIDNFNTGVFKGADVYNNCAGRGLSIQNSNVRNTIHALHSTTQFISAKHSFFKGNIAIEGLSYSNWYANRVKKGIPSSGAMASGIFVMQSPEESCLLTENLFDYCSLDFYGKNDNSVSLCNTWEEMDEEYAVVGEELVEFPASWGTVEFSAGNRHLDGDNMEPKMFSEDDLINYYYPAIEEEIFDYEGVVFGDESGQSECIYDQYPEGSVLFDSLFDLVNVNITSLNSYWLYLDSLRGIKETQIPLSSLEKQITLVEEIDHIEILQSDIVGRVLSNLESSDESVENVWLSRAHQGVIEYSELLALWYKRDFNKLDSLLGLESDPDAEVLLDAVEFLAMCLSRQIPMDSLPAFELDTLTDIAHQSYGNYSNIVRNYLNLVYDKQIFWPVNEIGLIPRSVEFNKPHTNIVSELKYNVNPNPANDCITIIAMNGDQTPITVQILSSSGHMVYNGLVYTDDVICRDSWPEGLYFVRIIERSGIWSETHKLIVQ